MAVLAGDPTGTNPWGGSSGWHAGAQTSQQANAWQNSPETSRLASQYAWNYYKAHPSDHAAANYAAYSQGATPNQVMNNPDLVSQLTAGSSSGGGGQGMDGSALWAALQGSVGPESVQLDLINKILGTQQGQQTKMVGLKQDELRNSSNSALAKNKLGLNNANNQLAHDKQGETFVNQLYGEANKAAGLSYGANRDALLSDATARGAVTAHGTVGQFRNQYETFTNQLAQNTTQRDRSLSDLRLSQQNAQNLAKSYGINENEIVNHLNNGLAQLGLQGQIDAGDILKAISSNDAQKAMLGQNLANQFIAMAQGNPDLLNFFNQMQNSSPSVKPTGVGGGRKVM